MQFIHPRIPASTLQGFPLTETRSRIDPSRDYAARSRRDGQNWCVHSIAQTPDRAASKIAPDARDIFWYEHSLTQGTDSFRSLAARPICRVGDFVAEMDKRHVIGVVTPYDARQIVGRRRFRTRIKLKNFQSSAAASSIRRRRRVVAGEDVCRPTPNYRIFATTLQIGRAASDSSPV